MSLSLCETVHKRWTNLISMRWVSEVAAERRLSTSNYNNFIVICAVAKCTTEWKDKASWRGNYPVTASLTSIKTNRRCRRRSLWSVFFGKLSSSCAELVVTVRCNRRSNIVVGNKKSFLTMLKLKPKLKPVIPIQRVLQARNLTSRALQSSEVAVDR